MPKLPHPERVGAVLAEARRLLDMGPDGGFTADVSAGLDEVLGLLQSHGYDDPRAFVRDLALASKECAAAAEACSNLEVAYCLRRERHKKNEDRLRSECLRIMQALPELFPEQRLQDATVTVWINPPRPGVVVTDVDKLADEFVQITRTPKKTRIAEAIRDGEVVEGAEMRNGAPSLTIRT